MSQPKHSLLPLFQENEVLFGHDGTPGLIAVEISAENQVTIFSRGEDGMRTEIAPFRPFLLKAGDHGLARWPGAASFAPLAGAGVFDRLVLFSSIPQLEAAKTFLQKKTGKAPSAGDAPYWYLSDPVHQFLLLSGKTHFLGMTFH